MCVCVCVCVRDERSDGSLHVLGAHLSLQLSSCFVAHLVCLPLWRLFTGSLSLAVGEVYRLRPPSADIYFILQLHRLWTCAAPAHLGRGCGLRPKMSVGGVLGGTPGQKSKLLSLPVRMMPVEVHKVI